MFVTDRPIESYKEDTLGRYPFAKSLGESILSYKNEESIAIGLFGGWGYGKTSIINMVEEYIIKASVKISEEKKPIIIRFNPWNYTNQNQIFTQFFKQLYAGLGKENNIKNLKTMGNLLVRYAEIIEPLALIPGAGPLFFSFAKIFRSFGNTAINVSDSESNDLNEIRKKIDRFLKEQNHKIIIIIDDIDRLYNDEIRLIFQLIKSIGDFPNTIYLLSFDHDVVINALKTVQDCPGEKYLDKVVQIPFEIPQISKEKVEQELFSSINALITDIDKEKWDSQYWFNIYSSGPKYFFENVRDVKRFINSFKFIFEQIKDEVNIMDLFAITVIQVFIPSLYYPIRENKDLFTGIAKYLDGGGDKKLSFKRRFNQILKINTDEIGNIKQDFPKELIVRNNKITYEILIDFLKRLFPKLEETYSNMNYTEESLKEWRKDMRICSPDFFDRYFILTLAEGEISQKEMESILKMGNNPKLFSEALLKLIEEKRISSFINRLSDYTKEIPKQNIEPIITVLMDIGDLIPEEDVGFLGVDISIRILRIIDQLVNRYKTNIDRFEILKNAMLNSKRSLYVMVRMVSIQDQIHGKFGAKKTSKPKEKLTVDSKQIERLESIVSNKIEEWAEDGRLANHKKLPSILFRWINWTEKEKINSFVTSSIKDDEGLIDFITCFLKKIRSQTVGDKFMKITWEINPDEIKEFVDLYQVEARLRKYVSSPKYKKLEDRKKEVIKIFLDTIDGKRDNPFIKKKK